jgi:hypothetical protein
MAEIADANGTTARVRRLAVRGDSIVLRRLGVMTDTSPKELN